MLFAWSSFKTSIFSFLSSWVLLFFWGFSWIFISLNPLCLRSGVLKGLLDDAVASKLCSVQKLSVSLICSSFGCLIVSFLGEFANDSSLSGEELMLLARKLPLSGLSLKFLLVKSLKLKESSLFRHVGCSLADSFVALQNRSSTYSETGIFSPQAILSLWSCLIIACWIFLLHSSLLTESKAPLEMMNSLM